MADGDLVFGSFECRNSDRSITLDLVEGLWEPALVRGEDAVIVGKAGRFIPPIGRVRDKRTLRLSGWVIGLGNTKEERWESLDATMVAVRDAFALTVIDLLTVANGYMGVAENTSRFLNARPMSVVLGPINSLAMVRIDIEMECVDSPPEWVTVADESS